MLASRGRLIDLYTSGIINKPDLEARLPAIDEQLKEPESRPRRQVLSMSDIAGMLAEWEIFWPTLDAKTKRTLLLSICPQIYMDHSGKRSTTLTLATVLEAGNVEVTWEAEAG